MSVRCLCVGLVVVVGGGLGYDVSDAIDVIEADNHNEPPLRLWGNGIAGYCIAASQELPGQTFPRENEDHPRAARTGGGGKYSYVEGRLGIVLSSIKDRWDRTISALEWYPVGKLKSYTEGEYSQQNPPASTGEKFTYVYDAASTTKQHSLGSRTYSYGPTGLVNDNVVFDANSGRVLSSTDDHGHVTNRAVYQ